jgi:hypothetical protein
VAILVRRHVNIRLDTSITYVKVDAGNFFLTLRQPPLQMVTENGFSIAPFYGDQNFSITTKGQHVICFGKPSIPTIGWQLNFFGHHKVW